MITGQAGRAVRSMMSAMLARGLVFAVLASLVLGPLGAGAQTIEQTSNAPASTKNWSPPRTVYIPETGHTIDGVFLDYWRANNGIASFGYPVTPEFTMSNGVVAQLYAYARFEYWPNAADGQVVKLGKIGEDLRPRNLLRNSIAAAGSSGSASANAEIALMTRAWLPLTG
ncbi:MAG: hypothetical protein M3Y37_00320, partial [Chloroflexota bacterium]|nr:hypothetical protein [Chloroflexota bacterium]